MLEEEGDGIAFPCQQTPRILGPKECGGGGGNGLSTKEKRTFYECIYFKFLAVFFTTKPRGGGGGGAKGLRGLSTKKKLFLRLLL